MKTKDYCNILQDLYAATFRDWNLTISIPITEPVCPCITITPDDIEVDGLKRYMLCIDDDDDIDDAVKKLCAFVKREVIEGDRHPTYEPIIGGIADKNFKSWLAERHAEVAAYRAANSD